MTDKKSLAGKRRRLAATIQSARPAGAAYGRCLQDFADLSTAEKALISACAAGEVCRVGTGNLPESPTPDNQIRAGLIRFLILGGDSEHPTHEEGVRLLGAWIHDPLMLDNVKCATELKLQKCRLDQGLSAQCARFLELDLQGTVIGGIRGDALHVEGGVLLRGVFRRQRRCDCWGPTSEAWTVAAAPSPTS